MRIRGFGRFVSRAVVALALLAVPQPSAAAPGQDLRTKQLEFEVHSALLRLPYYDVFDSLAFEIGDHGTVRLTGHVLNGWLKDGAERAVKRIGGVDTVINEIEILPASPGDDRIRFALYRSLFGDSGLYRYAMGAHPSIRIVVKHGRVTLEGLVNTTLDRTLAGFKAREVFGVFEVTNNLVVSKS